MSNSERRGTARIDWSKPEHRRWFLGVSLAALLALIVIWTGHGEGVFQGPVVRVAYNQFPPYLDRGTNAVPVGFAAEILTLAARRANVRIQWVEIPGSADNAFSQGVADVYPLMTITPEREAAFYMSAPWWENQFTLVSTESDPIRDASTAEGKLIATRVGTIQSLSKKLFPGARFVDMQTLDEMETALCEHRIDGFFSDVRLLQTQLLRRTAVCSGQPLRAATVTDSKLLLGTASTKAAAKLNDRLFREIAKLALDGTLARAASRWGIYIPYDTGRLKHVVNAETNERLLAWGLVVSLVILALSLLQTNAIRRAKRQMEAAQAEMKETRHRFDEFMRHTPAITFMKDESGRIVYSNEDSGPGEAVSRPRLVGSIAERISEREREVWELDRGVEVTETLRDPNGAVHHFLVLKFPFRGESGAKFLGCVALDVTSRVLAEKELEFYAKNDGLTGLPNRRSFMKELARILEGANAQSQGIAVGFLDLDGFKEVNDRFGHESGDELLKQASVRIKRVCPETGMVARLGGDEFTFFIREPNEARLNGILVAILAKFQERFSIAGEEIEVSASIGVTYFPKHGATAHELLRRADLAMYSAKKKGRARIEIWSKDSPPAEGDGMASDLIALQTSI